MSSERATVSPVASRTNNARCRSWALSSMNRHEGDPTLRMRLQLLPERDGRPYTAGTCAPGRDQSTGGQPGDPAADVPSRHGAARAGARLELGTVAARLPANAGETGPRFDETGTNMAEGGV